MAIWTFAELRASASLANIKANVVAGAKAVGLKTENWSEGGFSRTLVALFAQFYKSFSDIVAILASGGLLDTAEGAWLTLLASSTFGVDRIEATQARAVGGLTLTNGGGGFYTFDAGDIIVAHDSTGATYRNTTGGTLASGVGQTLTLDLAAEEAGKGSNAGVGDITTMITTFLGVTCENEVALVGTDAEGDPSLRGRCRNTRGTSSPGPGWRAYEYTARTAKLANGTSAGVTRALVMPAVGDGNVAVYVANASGPVTSEELTAVQDAFDVLTPYGLDSTALNTTALPISAPLTVWVPSSLGLSDAEIKTAINVALGDYVGGLSIGGVVIEPAPGMVYWRSLLAVASTAVPGTIKVQLDTETDTSVAEGYVPTWAGVPGGITVVQVT